MGVPLSERLSHMSAPFADILPDLAAAVRRTRLPVGAPPEAPSAEEFEREILAGHLDEALPEYAEKMSAVLQVFMTPPWRYEDLELPDNVDQLRADAAAGLAIYHGAWKTAVSSNSDLKHPHAGLLEAWYQRRQRVDPVHRLDGIAPRFDTVRDIRTDPEAFSTLPDLVGSHGVITQYLPGFEPAPRTIVPAPILMLYEGGGGRYVRRARPAPLALRLLYEVLMSVPLDRRETRSFLEVKLRDIRDWLYPSIERPDGARRTSYKPSKHLALIQQAIHEVHNLRVEVIPTGHTVPTLWLPVSARTMPTRHLDSAASFEVYLPPGGGRGALVDRRALRLLGLKSALMYRAYIGLSYFWDHYGRTENGKRAIESTRPVVLRNERGHMLNRAGEIILDSSGKPSLRWKRGIPIDAEGKPTSWEFAARELNPNALARYPVLDDDDLLHLCYPGERLAHGDGRRWNLLRKAREALRAMRDDGYCIILEDSGSCDGLRRGWHILPP